MLRRLWRWLVGTPLDLPRVRALERRLEDVEDELTAVKTRHERLRGRVLTLVRQLNQLDEDTDEDEDEEEYPWDRIKALPRDGT